MADRDMTPDKPYNSTTMDELDAHYIETHCADCGRETDELNEDFRCLDCVTELFARRIDARD